MITPVCGATSTYPLRTTHFAGVLSCDCQAPRSFPSNSTIASAGGATGGGPGGRVPTRRGGGGGGGEGRFLGRRGGGAQNTARSPPPASGRSRRSASRPGPHRPFLLLRG